MIDNKEIILVDNNIKISKDKQGFYRFERDEIIETYNPQYFTIRQDNNNKRQQLNKELNNLKIMTNLKKKIKTLNNINDKLQQAIRLEEEDNILLKRRGFEKAKALVIRYYNQLKEDINFKFSNLEKTAYEMIYQGDYLTSNFRVYLEVEGVIS